MDASRKNGVGRIVEAVSVEHEQRQKKILALEKIRGWLVAHVAEHISAKKPKVGEAVCAEIIRMLQEGDYEGFDDVGAEPTRPAAGEEMPPPPSDVEKALRYLSPRAVEMYRAMAEGQKMKVKFISKEARQDGPPALKGFVSGEVSVEFKNGKFLVAEVNFQSDHAQEGATALKKSGFKIGDELPLEDVVIFI